MAARNREETLVSLNSRLISRLRHRALGGSLRRRCQKLRMLIASGLTLRLPAGVFRIVEELL
jgi:hypothetical protein